MKAPDRSEAERAPRRTVNEHVPTVIELCLCCVLAVVMIKQLMRSSRSLFLLRPSSLNAWHAFVEARKQKCGNR